MPDLEEDVLDDVLGFGRTIDDAEGDDADEGSTATVKDAE